MNASRPVEQSLVAGWSEPDGHCFLCRPDRGIVSPKQLPLSTAGGSRNLRICHSIRVARMAPELCPTLLPPADLPDVVGSYHTQAADLPDVVGSYRTTPKQAPRSAPGQPPPPPHPAETRAVAASQLDDSSQNLSLQLTATSRRRQAPAAGASHPTHVISCSSRRLLLLTAAAGGHGGCCCSQPQLVVTAAVAAHGFGTRPSCARRGTMAAMVSERGVKRSPSSFSILL